MFRTTVIVLVIGCSLPVAHAAESGPSSPRPQVSLTVIPPSPITDKVALDLRSAVRNDAAEPVRAEVTWYLDEEQPHRTIHRASLDIPPHESAATTFRWPTTEQAGQHLLFVTARIGSTTHRTQQRVTILASDVRSTRRLGGAWVDLYHHDPVEGKPFDEELGQMTDTQWRELVQAMHAVDQNLLVITMMFQNFTHRGQHTIETDGYQGRAYYPSRLYPGRMPIASPDPLEAILCEADRLHMHVMPGVGNYAFFDFSPGALRWCQQVATELWERYGHHPSFYGWYVSHEKGGSLGDAAERQEIVEFFREFTPFVRRFAPDKPVMLATNCYGLRGAEEAYRQLLPHLDIICPFAFHRMPPGDLTGEEAADLLQSLCDETGCHLWLDIESFLFREGGLVPRPIDGLISDLTRFPNFEKTLHYQFPGMMSGPQMTRQPGGPASVQLYEDYVRYLQQLTGGSTTAPPRSR